MKKIMKKVLSLTLALVMVLSLAPMTAQAEEPVALESWITGSGTGTEADPFGIRFGGSNMDEYIEVAANTKVYYKFLNGEGFEFAITSYNQNLVVGYNGTETPLGSTGALVEVLSNPQTLTADCEFYVYNPSGGEIEFTLGLPAEPPALGSEENPEVVDLNETNGYVYEASADEMTEAYGQIAGYFYEIVAPADGTVGFEDIVAYNASADSADWLYVISNMTTYKYGEELSSLDEVPAPDNASISVRAGDIVLIRVAPCEYVDYGSWGYNAAIPGAVELTIYFEGAAGPAPKGEIAADAVETTNGGKYKNNYNLTYYSYVAEENGVLSVATDGEMGFNSISGRETITVDDYVSSNGVTKIQLAKDEKIIYYVKGTKDVTEVNVSYENGATLVKPVVPEEADYEVSESPLALGEKTYLLSNVPYTVFEFAPTATGVYKITILSEDTVMGNLGATILASRLTDSIVKETTLTVECKEVGPSWNIAVAGATDKVVIKVEKTGDASQGPGYPEYWGGYELVSQEAYKYEGKVEDIKFVNIKDDVDKAVLGSDSLYHLNSADGPVIFVDLDDSKIISLYDVFVNGGMKAAYYDENGKIDHVVDYSSYFNYVYETLADKDTKLYPLTCDLMEMIQEVGNTEGKDWYDVTNQYGVKSAKEDAWMFACCYNESIKTFKAPFKIFPTYVPVDPEEPTFDKDTMKELVDLNKTQPVALYTSVGEDKFVTFTFAPNTLALVDGVEEYDFSVELVEEVKEVTNKKVTADNFVLRINFAYSGKLPAEATIAIPVPEAYEGKTLYYYQIMEDGSLKYVCDAPVAGGVATVTQDHCSDYVLLTEKVADDAKAPKTGDNSNIALWVAVLGLGVVAMSGSVVMKKREF